MQNNADEYPMERMDSYNDWDNNYIDQTFEPLDDDLNENILSLGRTGSYQILKPEELEKYRKNTITQIQEFTCLPEDESIILLIHYQWNAEKINDTWYDDPNFHMKKAGIQLTEEAIKQLNAIKVIENNKDCLICYSELDNNDSFALKCGHRFCNECWSFYLESKIDDIFTCIVATCPQKMCSLVVPESVYRSYLPKNRIKELDKAILKNFTDRNADIKWCPTPDCGFCVRSSAHTMKEIACDCKNVFCFYCGKEGHKPISCEMEEIWNVKNNSEGENVAWLKVNTKKCPSCSRFIEKNQGCNHMTCRKEAGGCGYEFCWICLGEWKPHGSEYYNCNKFDPKKAEEDAKVLNNSKLELQRYVFFYDRYINHDRSMKLSIGLRDKIKNEIDAFNNIKQLSYDELRFLGDAVETIIKAHRVLKNTYIFGFYMKDVPEVALFQHHQNLLEKNVDKLHGMMEDNSKKKIIEIDNFETFNKEWNNFKANVVNLASVTLKFMENILNEIENKMLDLVVIK